VRLLSDNLSIQGSQRLFAPFLTFVLNFSLNLFNQLRPILYKTRMMVIVVAFIPLFGEAVHIQLSYIGVHIIVFEE